MDYKEKYEQALEKVRVMLGTGDYTRESLEYVFPELKESEDERVRKGLIELVKQSSEILEKKNQEQMIAWLEKQEQKPADKAKPKFKVGDFILNGDVTEDGKPEIFKVLNVQDTWYDVENIYDGRNTIITFRQDFSCRLWDLRDAKDGDFLIYGKDKLPFIFKGFDRFHPDCPVAYCGIGCDGTFQVCTGDGWWTDKEVFPANKDQREHLLKAMADAGYISMAMEHEAQKGG